MSISAAEVSKTPRTASTSAALAGASVKPASIAVCSTSAMARSTAASAGGFTRSPSAPSDMPSRATFSDRLTFPRPIALAISARSACSSPSIHSGTRSRRSNPLPLTLRISQAQLCPAPCPRRAANPVIDTVFVTVMGPSFAVGFQCLPFVENVRKTRFNSCILGKS